MFKKIILLTSLIVMLVGCTLFNNKIEKIYLSDKFYNKGTFTDIKSDDVTNYTNDKYLLFVYNDYCTLPTPCDKIFKSVGEKNQIDFLSMSFEEFKKTDYYKTVLYAPSVLIIDNGKIVTFLDAEKDSDLPKYQDTDEFENWLDTYIYLKKE